MGLLSLFKRGQNREFDEREKQRNPVMIQECLKQLVKEGFDVKIEGTRSLKAGSSQLLTFRSKTNPNLKLQIDRSIDLYEDAKYGKMFGGVKLTTPAGQEVVVEPYKLQDEARGSSNTMRVDKLGRNAPEIINLIDKQAYPDPRWAQALTKLAGQSFPNASRSGSKQVPMAALAAAKGRE